MKRFCLSVLTAGLLVLVLSAGQTARMVVHEWGTITTRHGPDGAPIGRLNRIDASDVLPAFVHRYEPPATRQDSQRSLLKTPVVPGRPDVTMRLETPVLYFYPPAGSRSVPPFDVGVRFRGGIVNEFYPRADASVEVDAERVNAKMQAGLLSAWDGEALNNYVVGGLQWRGLSLRDSVSIPATTSPVWLAPRRVHASSVLIPEGEGERYLFYRGVAHLDALLQTRLVGNEVRLYEPSRLPWLWAPSMTLRKIWLVDVRPDGRVAYRERENLVLTKQASREVARLSLFDEADHTVARAAELRRSMKQALMAAGLFEEEAEAMLETWKESYYRSPGLRVFYVVPTEWTSYFLPLQISIPHDLTRVLVGRIDLVTS